MSCNDDYLRGAEAMIKFLAIHAGSDTSRKDMSFYSLMNLGTSVREGQCTLQEVSKMVYEQLVTRREEA